MAVHNHVYRRIAWKAILSEAVVTEGEALGISMLNSCLEGSTSPLVKNMLRAAWRLVFNCFARLEKVYFLFIALKRMAAVASLRSATVGSERRWCQTYGLGVKNSFLYE